MCQHSMIWLFGLFNEEMNRIFLSLTSKTTIMPLDFAQLAIVINAAGDKRNCNDYAQKQVYGQSIVKKPNAPRSLKIELMHDDNHCYIFMSQI